MIKLTDKQFEVLAQFESYFTTLSSAGWCPRPLLSEFTTMHQVYKEIGGSRTLNYGCQNCILGVIRELANVYLPNKQQRIDAQNDAAAISAAKTQRKKPSKSSKR